jgi:hypothetical protein
VKRITAAVILGLFSLFITRHAAAQDPETAGEVVDAATLEALVLYALSQAAAVSDPNDVAPFIISLGIEGKWKQGNTFLILMQPDGTVYSHGGDTSVSGKNILMSGTAEAVRLYKTSSPRRTWAEATSATSSRPAPETPTATSSDSGTASPSTAAGGRCWS